MVNRSNLLMTKAIISRLVQHILPLCNQFHLEAASNHSPTDQVFSSNWWLPGVGRGVHWPVSRPVWMIHMCKSLFLSKVQRNEIKRGADRLFFFISELSLYRDFIDPPPSHLFSLMPSTLPEKASREEGIKIIQMRQIFMNCRRR